MSKLPCAYQPGTVVYRRLDSEGTPGMVLAVTFDLGGAVTYDVRWEDMDEANNHFEPEITTVRSFKVEEEATA